MSDRPTNDARAKGDAMIEAAEDLVRLADANGNLEEITTRLHTLLGHTKRWCEARGVSFEALIDGGRLAADWIESDERAAREGLSRLLDREAE